MYIIFHRTVFLRKEKKNLRAVPRVLCPFDEFCSCVAHCRISLLSQEGRHMLSRNYSRCTDIHDPSQKLAGNDENMFVTGYDKVPRRQLVAGCALLYLFYIFLHFDLRSVHVSYSNDSSLSLW